MSKLKSRTLRIIGSIDEPTFKQFSEELAECEEAKIDNVLIELSSPGGTSYDALAFAARIRNSSCTTTVRCYGLAASAAVLVLAAGDYRQMAKEAWVMVHEDSDKLRGNVVDLERESAHLRRMEKQWAKLLAEVTDVSAYEWECMHKKTTYLCAAECLKMGLIGRIV